MAPNGDFTMALDKGVDQDVAACLPYLGELIHHVQTRVALR